MRILGRMSSCILDQLPLHALSDGSKSTGSLYSHQGAVASGMSLADMPIRVSTGSLEELDCLFFEDLDMKPFTSKKKESLVTSQEQISKPQPLIEKDVHKNQWEKSNFEDFMDTPKKTSLSELLLREKSKPSLMNIFPGLILQHDETTINKKTFIRISFTDQITNQILLLKIRCNFNKEEISEEELISLLLEKDIEVVKKLNWNSPEVVLIAYTERLQRMHVSMIYPATDHQISEHKGKMITANSTPSMEYTEYRKQQNEFDLQKSWIRRILERDISENNNIISELRVNSDGNIILVQPLSVRQKRIICIVDYDFGPIYSLRDLQGTHLWFLKEIKSSIKAEIQQNEDLSSYRESPIYIEVEYPPKIHCLHFSISASRNHQNFEIDHIIEKLEEDMKYWNNTTINNVRISSLDPRAKFYS